MNDIINHRLDHLHKYNKTQFLSISFRINKHNYNNDELPTKSIMNKLKERGKINPIMLKSVNKISKFAPSPQE